MALLLSRVIPAEIVRQLSLIITGIVLTYILLPDPEQDIQKAVARSSIWLADATELRSVVGSDRLKQAAHGLLLGADPLRAPIAWVHGCVPILELEDHPDSLIEDATYQIWMEPLDAIPMYSVKTIFAAKRVLPPHEGRVWVSFARTREALESEYERRPCLLRELIEVEDDTQWEQVTGEHLKATLTIDSVEHAGSVEPAGREPAGRDLVRMVFDSVQRPDRPTPIKLEANFALPLSTRFFPVRFASYYCLGTTEIEFYINDKAVESVDASIFFTREFQRSAEGHSWQKEETRSRAPGRAERRFKRVRIGPDRLLWPGSGAVFTWERQKETATWHS